MRHNERYKQAKKTTLIGAFVNVLLGFIKLIGGVFFHSHALVADGIHSFSDLIADAMVLVASKYGSQDADDLHPYGHQRIETIATFFLAMVLMLAGVGIAWESLRDIINKTESIPDLMALPIAILSIIANEGLFRYTRLVGIRIQSDLITANAWHHRSDAASSLIVSIGVIGSFAGYKYLDPLAACVVGFMIIKMGLKYAWDSTRELIDTGVSPKKVAHIKKVINQVDGVLKIHQLRNRMMGQNVLVDVHILVSPLISVSEGHFIAQRVHGDLMKQISQIKDVTVHVDPEDDELISPSEQSPNRTTIENTLLNAWKCDFPGIQSWVLHYLDGTITIDLIINDEFNQYDVLQQRMQSDLLNQKDVISIRLLKNVRKVTS